MILTDKIVHVLGAGRSGRAAAALAASCGAEVTLFDSSDSIPNPPEGVNAYAKASEELGESLACDLLVLSPGIDTYGSYVRAFSTNAKQVIGETELGSQFYTGIVIGITGTNGKTTTTEIVQAIMVASDVSCVCCGNHGMPLSEVVMLDEVPDSIALELSSFQLETISTLRPKVSLWLNFDEDHMDRYSCIEDYKKAKLRIFENQTTEDIAIVRCGEDVGDIHPKLIRFTTEHSNAELSYADGWISLLGEKLVGVSTTKLRGLHNIENVMAATAACLHAGVNKDQLQGALNCFIPPKHRCELVRTLDGVEYLNDSKATNLHALDSALRSQSDPVILIAGGKQKGLDYSDLLPRLKATTQHAILFGEIGEQLSRLFSQVVSTTVVDTLDEAVLVAREHAEFGNVVLLSPGTSSFDQFKGYEHRGEVFIDAVNKLT